MQSFNKVQLVGWLGQDIVVKKAKGGCPYASFSISTNNLQQTTDGKTHAKTNWHKVWLWDLILIQRYQHNLIKGSRVMVEGSLNYRDYTTAEGIRHHVAEIKATVLVDLDR